MPLGWFIWALVAGPPSPENPVVPLPAKTLTRPVVWSSFKTRLNSLSRKYAFPRESKRTAAGALILAVAGKPTGPPPMTVVMFCA